jgi:taurine dioxygenase
MRRTPGLTIRPSGAPLGAEIVGVDLAEDLDTPTLHAIEAAYNTHTVVFRHQHLTPEHLLRFARRFGPLEISPRTQFALSGFPEILLLSNIIDAHGRPISNAEAGLTWHTDLSYTATPPRGSLLYAVEVPRNAHREALGATHFASAAAAYESSPAALKTRLEGLRAVHRVAGRRARTGTGQQDNALRTQQPDVVHPVVRTHPYTGQKCLYVNEGECGAIEGMATDEALALIAELATWVLQPQFRHVHNWQAHDLLMWDNCSVQHLATFDYQWPQHRRLMQRITVGGSVPF